MPQATPQNNGIPTNPEVSQQLAAAAAGASPVQVHQGAPAGIPSHPGVQVQQYQNQMQDFFSSMGLDGGDSDIGVEEPGTVPPPQGSQPQVPPGTVDLLSEEDLLGGGLVPQPPAQQPPQQQPQQPQGFAPQTPQAPQQPVVQPQAPQAAPASAPQQSPEDLQRAAIDYLRNGTYAFNDEQSRRALTEPEVVLPELAARLHVNVVHEMAQQMHRVLPHLIEQEVARRQAAFEAKQEFFGRYPKLNRPEWQPVILESLQMAAQMNQGKPRDVIMQEGAALAAYRIRSQHRSAPSQQRQQPFVPASPGSGGPVVPQNPQGTPNVWAELSQDPDLFNF